MTGLGVTALTGEFCKLNPSIAPISDIEASYCFAASPGVGIIKLMLLQSDFMNDSDGSISYTFLVLTGFYTTIELSRELPFELPLTPSLCFLAMIPSILAFRLSLLAIDEAMEMSFLLRHC